MAQLLQPLTIGSLTLSNRLVMPPMATAKAFSDGMVSRELLDYYAEKSAGGYISLIIIEHSYISPEGKASACQLSVATDDAIGGLQQLAETIHQNGSKAILQINHAGSAASNQIIGTIPLAPSAISNPRKGNMPRAVERAEIAYIVEAFQEAARRVKEAGFDGVEIHSAHGYLLNQFFSPLTNHRSDEYGGDVQGRIKIHLEIIKAVRSVVGSNFPLFLRLGASDHMDGGTTITDSQAAAGAFAEAGVDVLDISGGFCGYTVPGLKEQGYFAPLSIAVKKAVSVPVILTGGITMPEAAEAILTEGKADLVGVGRAILADSNWARKAVKKLK